MFVNDLPFIFLWWSVIFFLGAIFFPLTARFFSSFVDRGYIFAKILALVVLSYTSWLLGSLKLLPFSFPSLLLILLLFLTGNLIFLFQRGSQLKSISQKKTLLVGIFLEEVLFLATLTFWSFIKGHQPDIESLEKYMDFGFINSILRSLYFPPLDMWLAQSPDYSGHFINYYYFGHLTTAVLTKLTGINPGVSYNLMLATIFAFCFTASFSLGMNYLIKILPTTTHSFREINFKTVLGGLITGFLVTLGGNLHTIYAFTKGYTPNENPLPVWQVLGWPIKFTEYWYPNATRFIPYTIHEFPSYSFVVSDLHGHVLDIPFVLLTIALLSALIFKGFIEKKYVVILALMLSVMYMTNAWDGAIYFGLCSLVFTYLFWKSENHKQKFFDLAENLYQQIKFIPRFLIKTPFYLFILGLFFLLFSLPFHINFKPFVSGIGISQDHSAWWMLLTLWGFFYWCVLGFLIFIVKDIKKTSPVNILFVCLIILSTLLLIFPEFFYAKDIYPKHYRANTMFKLGYQAFIMLALVSGVTVTRFLFFSKNVFKLTFPKSLIITTYYFILLIFIFLVSIYPYFAVSSYFDNLKNYKGLYGLSYLDNKYPDDYKAIIWLGTNAYSAENFYQPTILEAVGDSYTTYARVSANTGLPTVQGWPVHEWLWRGGYDEPGKRVEEVKNIYTGDSTTSRNLLTKYQVKYVFVGDLEREKYPDLKEDNFSQLGEVVFQSGKTKIYQITQ